MTNLDEHYFRKIGILLEASKEASARSRRVFTILTLACTIIMFAVVNAEWAWSRHLNVDERPKFGYEYHFFPSLELIDSVISSRNKQIDIEEKKLVEAQFQIDSLTEVITTGNKNKAIEQINKIRDSITFLKKMKSGLNLDLIRHKREVTELRNRSEMIERAHTTGMGQAYLNDFMERSHFSIPIIGLKSSVWDLQIFASFALLVISVWNFFTIRREHYVTYRINKEISLLGVAYREAPDISNRQTILNTIEYLFNGCIQYHVFNTATKEDAPHNEDSNIIARLSVVILRFLPVIAIAVPMYSDYASLSRLAESGFKVPWIEIINREIVATFFGILCFYLVSKNYSHSKEIEKLLKSMRQVLVDVKRVNANDKNGDVSATH